MTTIAWDGEMLAADTMLMSGSMRCGYARKIHRMKGCLIGFCGASKNFERFYSWFMAGAIGDFTSADGNVFIIAPNGHTVIWGDGPPWREAAKKWTLGDGGDVAMGAMMAGATAEQALKAAIEVNVNSGGEITTLRL